MADHRCRWCGDYLLLPRFGGDGEPFCSDACCVESLERTLDIPSISPLIPGFPQANGTVCPDLATAVDTLAAHGDTNDEIDECYGRRAE